MCGSITLSLVVAAAAEPAAPAPPTPPNDPPYTTNRYLKSVVHRT